MASNHLILGLFITCVLLLPAQCQPSPELVSHIYRNAPPVVQEALRSVGFPSNSRFIASTDRRPKFIDSSSKASAHKAVLPPPPSVSYLNAPKPPQMKTGPVSPIITPRLSPEILRRRESPFVLIRPMSLGNARSSSSKSKGKIVLALPDDNIHILSAEALSELGRAPNLIPTTLTIRPLNDNEKQNGDSKNNHGKRNNGGSTAKYSSQIPTPPNNYQESRNFKNYGNYNNKYQYNFLPAGQSSRLEDDSEEEETQYYGQNSFQDNSFEDYDEVLPAGGHVTVIKAQKGAGMPKILKAQRISGSNVSPMKAIFIQPKEIKAKRVTVMKANSRQVSPMKATLVKASAINAMKTNAQAVSIKSGSAKKAKTHRNDRPHYAGSSNVHFLKMEPQMETGESRLLGDPGIALPPEGLSTDHENQIPPIDLHCGGNNDYGWCDLGPHYPISEVSQIMEVCEELVSRMYVENPGEPEVMEDILPYSMSHNITDHFSKRWDTSSWKWDGKPAPSFQGSLCDTEKSYIQPSFAQDIRGKWHVIIQTDKFSQKVPLEVCKNPGEPCHRGEVCSHQSQCVQKYTYQHLVSFDPESAETCPFIRLYKFPTSCVCRIPITTGH